MQYDRNIQLRKKQIENHRNEIRFSNVKNQIKFFNFEFISGHLLSCLSLIYYLILIFDMLQNLENLINPVVYFARVRI